jgi:uncharacterized protein
MIGPPADAPRASDRWRGHNGASFISTQPLDEETENTGPLAARLWASATTSDADLFPVVRIFNEQGKEKLESVSRSSARTSSTTQSR